MPQRQSRIVLILMAVLYMAALVLSAPRFERFGDEAFAACAELAGSGLVFAPPALLALWAVLGRQRVSVRLPLACWMFAAVFMAATYGEVRNYGRGDASFILLASVAWLTASLTLMLALRLLRAVRGWRLERVGDDGPELHSADENQMRQRQFTVRTLLAWTFAIALLCAGLRKLMLYGSSDIDAWPADAVAAGLIEGAFIGLLVALAALPVLSVAWIVLADGRRIVLRCVLAAITVSGIAGAKLIFESLDDEQVVGRFVLLSEAGVLTAALFAVSIVRTCGFRLVRRPRGAMPAARELPPVVRSRRGRLAYSLGLLGTAAMLLAAYAPQRFEIWRRGDETQRWAAMGWEVDFDDQGRITRVISSCRDLAESEFQLAELHDLTSLNFSHSWLTDVQFSQYPLQNPALASLRSLNLSGSLIGDAALTDMTKFPKLTDLNLSSTHVTQAGLADLANLQELSTLNLSLTDIGDEAIAALAQLRGLRKINLELTAVSEAGAKKLQAVLPNATIVCGASDAVLRQSLTFISRTFTAGRRTLSINRNSLMLKHLHLRGGFSTWAPATLAPADHRPSAAVTDAGLAILAGQTTLEELDLRESGVTDAGLQTLAKLTNLKRLDLRGTNVSEQGCGRLAKALPDCLIVR